MPGQRLVSPRAFLSCLNLRLHLGGCLVVVTIVIVISTTTITATITTLQLQPIQIGLQLVALHESKGLVLPDDAHGGILGRQSLGVALGLGLLVVGGDTSGQCAEGVHDEVVDRGIGDVGPVVLLEVGPAGLRPRPDGRGVVLVDVAGGAGLVEVGTGLVVAGHEEADPVRPPHVGLGGPLVPVGQVGHEAAGGHVGPVDVLVVEALGAHPLGQAAGVGGQAGDADADVGVDLQYLLLVGRQLRDGPLQGADDGVRGGTDADARRSLCWCGCGWVVVDVFVVGWWQMHIGTSWKAVEAQGEQQKSAAAAEPRGESQRDGRHAVNADSHVIISTTSNTMQFNIIGRGGGDSRTATACPHADIRPTDQKK